MPVATLKKNALTWDGSLTVSGLQSFIITMGTWHGAGRCGAGAESATS